MTFWYAVSFSAFGDAVMEAATVLIIEDDVDIANIIRLILEEEKIKAEIITSGATGLEVVKRQSYSLVILDLNLPDVDGTNILGQIRSFSSVPVLIITGRRDDKSRGICWRLGADDYLTKPFDCRLLQDKINKLICSSVNKAEGFSEPILRLGDLEINFSLGTVNLQDQPVYLSTTEYRIMCVLATNRGRFVPTKELLEIVWPHETYHDDPGIVRVNIARVRKKLENVSSQPLILSESGRGYSLAPRVEPN